MTGELPRLAAADATVDAVVAAMDEAGGCIVERLVPPEGVEALRDALAPVLEATPSGRNDFEGDRTRRVYALFAKTRAFDEWALHPLLVGVLDAVLGPHHQFSAPVGIDIGPGQSAQVLHRDESVYPLPEPHDEVVVNSMWALDDFTTANGATRIIPGSHRWEPGRRPTDADEADVVQAVMPAGSVLFYNGSVWHGGGANSTDQRRLGVILEYVVSWLRPQENHVLAVPPEVVATLPRRLQEYLGYNIFPAFVGYVDGRHPARTLS